jgi:hypothetical protein
VLIALDQAEELARAKGEGADIVGALLKAAALAEAGPGESQPYAIMITVRSDSFAEVQASDRFEGLTTRSADIRTLPIYRYASAIEEPAARYGVKIEPALIEALIEDAGGKDALPLLAFTLQRLWRQYQAEKRIVKANYDSIGKVSGLVEDAAERALRGLDPLAPQGPLAGRVSAEQDRRTARLFVPTLAQVNESGAAIRRVAKLEAFDAGVQLFLASLVLHGEQADPADPQRLEQPGLDRRRQDLMATDIDHVSGAALLPSSPKQGGRGAISN